MVHKLGPETSAGLLVFHCPTGCDSTTYYNSKGRGKGEALKYYLREHNKYLHMKQLGVTLDLSEEVQASAAASKFVAALYRKTMQLTDGDLNSLRYKLFVQPGK